MNTLDPRSPPSWSPAALALVLTGCPATQPTPAAIDAVQVVEGSVESAGFTLELRGHGFGLDRVRYDFGGGGGAVETEAPFVILAHASSAARARSESAEIVSPNLIRARFRLSERLSAGRYQVELHAGTPLVPIATPLADAFEVRGRFAPDAGGTDASPGEAGGPEAGPADAGADAGAEDALSPDAGFDPEAWIGNFRGRRRAILNNPSPQATPPGTTIRLSLDHAQLVNAGLARPDGRDLALYLQGQRLEHQWEEPSGVGSSALAMVVRLPAALEPGPTDVALYYGDATASFEPSDGVYLLAARFETGLPAGWAPGGWEGGCLGFPSPGGNGGVCAHDQPSYTRLALSTPALAVPDPFPSNARLELVARIGGVTVEADDVLYLAQGDADPAAAEDVPLSAYTELLPNTQATFDEANAARRTVAGWNFGPTGAAYGITRARFSPTRLGPYLHVRYVSPNAQQSPGTEVRLDDLRVRLAVEPEIQAAWAAPETR